MKKFTPILLAAALLLCAHAPGLAQEKSGAESKPARAPQKFVREGVEVEFTVEPLARAAGAAELTAGQEAVVRFRLRDTATGTPLSGVRPSAWASLRGTQPAPDQAQCREKVQSYLQGSLRARPDVDLNAYYLLALNQEPNLSVIDPLLGFGGSKLITLVMLKSPGEDWALTADRARLFVSMPLVNSVAVVDTTTWKVVEEVAAGARPTRLALQPDGKYLWAVGDAGVTAIDAASLKVAATIPTGAGAHEVAFSDDNRFAYVGNRADGTLSVIDIPKLSKLKDVKTGAPASALAYSPLSKSLYVANEREGSIAVVDGRGHELVARIAAEPGLKSVRFAPGGRWGFVPNAERSVVHVFDASTNRMAHSVPVGKSPDQVAFTDAFAYVRSLGTEEVSAVRLSTVGKEPDVIKFPGGQNAPGLARAFASRADAFVPAPEPNSILLANPADRMIYYYAEGMAAPMGNFQNYKREARAVKVVDRSLREESLGVYATTARLPKEGVYDISFLLGSPRVVHCFEATAKPDPNAEPERKPSLSVEYLNKGTLPRAGESYKIQFKLTDPATGRPVEGLKDVRVLFFLSPGIWQKRDIAASVGGGVYELEVNVPQDGVYMVFVESRSRGVGFRQLPHLTLTTAAN
ncbi:MAG TPA: cytochrome D1 domain-containing protein [Pyrinomonadaceae bacterium]|nr:cytochrome D1 domain-containing protein [Pyrinomonadaceae bacterium]